MPPRFGTLDLAKFASRAGKLDGFRTDKLTLKGASILELHIEIDDDPADALIPRTMHPAIPAYAIFNVTHYPESPCGPFTIAEVRVAGRTGVRPRGFVLGSVCSNPEAARVLSSRWGYPCIDGDARLEQRHDRVVGRASIGGRTVLEIEMQDREGISGNDIQYIASMHLARNSEDGKLILVQVDPDYVYSKAERGKPRVVALDADAFGAAGNLRLANPIAACFAVGDVTLPRIRYICNPELPAMQGTTSIAA
jgi:hypothetical protein